ncbi:MAG: hypothetical protein QM783_10085 [Phycisphaerales bacterium]
MKPVTIKDDRGRSVPLFPGNGGLKTEADRVILRSFDTSRTRTLGTGEIVGIAVSVCFVLAALVINDLGLLRPLPRFVPLLIAAGLSAPFIIIAARSMLQRQSNRVRDALLQAGFCASCGYTRSGHEPGRSGSGDDGLVLCPECGAWWRPTSQRSIPSTPTGSSSVAGGGG